MSNSMESWAVPPPDWVQDAVFYQIFPDRFAKSEVVPKPSGLQPWGSPPTVHGYQGGDLIGVVERMDYLADLGVNALYFNPIFRSASNHRYHTHDYFTVDPMLGGNAAARRLFDAAHAHGIRVVLDGVFNHASRGFFQFHDILENGQNSPYLDWFHIQDWPLHPYGYGRPNYTCWWDNPALPKFNTTTQAVRNFLLEVVRYWIEFGADGWRVDVPNEIDDDTFWREFRNIAKGANPEAYLVGEIWDDATRWMQGDQFDAVMNYPLGRAALGFFAAETLDEQSRPGGFRVRPLMGRAFANEVDRLLARYPWPVTLAQLNLLESHDTARFLHQAGGDLDALKLATLFIATAPGAPCFYYGSEVGVTGGPDPDSRRAFPWDQSVWDRGLLQWTREAIRLRHSHPALRRGDFRRLYASDGLYVYGRRYEEDAAVVAFNASRTEAAITADVSDLLHDGVARDELGGLPGRISRGSLRSLALPPRSAAVFVRQ